MTAPVFVIHGIGNRDKAAFGQIVETLAIAVGGITARPVFWGDLGARYEWVADTVPGASIAATEVRDADAASDPEIESLAHFLIGGAAPYGTEIRTGTAVPDAVLNAATDFMLDQAGGFEEVRGEHNHADAVRAALMQDWDSTTWLQLIDDTELLRAVGAAIAGPIADGSVEPAPAGGAELRDAEVRGVDVVGFVRRRVQELDRVVGAAVGAAAGRLNTELRTSFLPGLTESVGDILVYQRHREKIRNRVRAVIDEVDPNLGRTREQPVDVLAHSLGGVIAVDMATSDEPIWIRRLVTFGSQSPFFHVVDPRGGALMPYAGTPIELPESIGAWTNLWEPLDPVAFVAARVFRLHNGSKPNDVKVPHLASSGLWTHSSYWTLQDVTQAIAKALA